MNNNELYNSLTAVAEKYGFTVEETQDRISFYANTTDGTPIEWFFYDKKKDIIYTWNTDQTNIWLCDTRKDFAPEKCIEFVKEVNQAMDAQIPLSHLIDPEDWQVIANCYDAYEDKRYTEN